MTVPAGEGSAGAADFDFLLGAWTVEHRRLGHPFAGNDEWATFGGITRVRPILAGRGNFDENVIELPDGTYHACTIRTFDPRPGQWASYWIDGRDPKLDPPMTGAFADGVGAFHGDGRFGGRPIRVRFLWTGMTSESPHWEQAYSADGGATWETNWTMRFHRA